MDTVNDNNHPPCKWNTDTLHAHIMAILAERQEARKAELDAMTARIAERQEAMNARLEGMNEWRATVQDVINSTVSRKEAFAFLIAALGIVFSVIAAWGTLSQ